jgi:hypothetical protein
MFPEYKISKMNENGSHIYIETLIVIFTFKRYSIRLKRGVLPQIQP